MEGKAIVCEHDHKEDQVHKEVQHVSDELQVEDIDTLKGANLLASTSHLVNHKSTEKSQNAAAARTVNSV